MATAKDLAARIVAAANGDKQFPARIGTSATALASLARVRFRTSPTLFLLCQSLDASLEEVRGRRIYTGLTDDDAKIIGFFLANSTTMSPSLNLDWSKVEDDVVAAMGEVIEATLSKIFLDENHTGGTNAMAIGEVLSTAQNELQLQRKQVGHAVAAAICKGFKTNAAMTELNLSETKIGDVGAAAIGEALKMNITLTKLSLYSSQIGDTGAASIGEALRTNTALTKLSLCFSQVGDAGAAAIGDALKTNASLISLALIANKIGDAGAAAIAHALRTNAALRELRRVDGARGI